MPLSDMKKGIMCIFKDMQVNGTLRQKLSYMGLTPGAKLQVVNASVGGCSVIEVRGTRLALASNILNMIEVDVLSKK